MARHQCALWNQRGLSPEFPHRTLGWNASWWFSNAPDAENSPLITGRDKLLTAAITSKLTTYSSCCRPGQYDPDKWTTCSQKQIGWHRSPLAGLFTIQGNHPGGGDGGRVWLILQKWFTVHPKLHKLLSGNSKYASQWFDSALPRMVLGVVFFV